MQTDLRSITNHQYEPISLLHGKIDQELYFTAGVNYVLISKDTFRLEAAKEYYYTMSEKNRRLVFLSCMRQHVRDIDVGLLSVRLSVCLSVTLWYCI